VSRSIAIFSSENIDFADFSDFIGEIGGKHDSDAVVLAGVDGTVWIYGLRNAFRGVFETPYYEESRRAIIDGQLGGSVKLALYLALARVTRSSAVALEFARRFALRWRAVVSCAAYEVFPVSALGAYLDSQRMPDVLCGEVGLVCATVPDLAVALEAFCGLALDPSDNDLSAEAERTIRAWSTSKYDSSKERVEGCLSIGRDDIWILSEMLEAKSLEEHKQRFGALVMDRLAGTPRWVGRVVFDSAAPEVEQLALRFVRRVLETHGGVMEGTFELLLDAAEVEQWCALDYGWRIQ
jgi:hypothetical protein